MPRTRTPSPELTAQDKSIAAGAAQMLRAIAARHDSGVLLGAAHLIDRFVETPAATAKQRVRKPKAALEQPTYPDRKSAAANDARELAHHSV